MQNRSITILFQYPVSQTSNEHYLALQFVLKQDQTWAKAGHTIAWEQFKLPVDVPTQTFSPDGSETPLTLSQQTDQLIVTGVDFKYSFNSHSGYLTQMEVHDQQYLAQPLKPNLWRARIDNDISALIIYPWAKRFFSKHIWRIANQKINCVRFVSRLLASGKAQVEVAWKVPGGKKPFQTTFTISADGTIHVKSSFTPAKELDRMGMQLALPGEFNQVEYFGLGPQETMPDRLAGAWVGKFTTTVDQLAHHYVRPQENGNRSQVRFLQLFNQAGSGLSIQKADDNNFNFSALPYTQEQLQEATHIHQLEPSGLVTLNIDLTQKGVGGDVPAGGTPHDDYRLFARKTLQYQFLLKPFISHSRN